MCIFYQRPYNHEDFHEAIVMPDGDNTIERRSRPFRMRTIPVQQTVKQTVSKILIWASATSKLTKDYSTTACWVKDENKPPIPKIKADNS